MFNIKTRILHEKNKRICLLYVFKWIYMSLDLSQCLVIGISSRALFDLEEENDLFNSDEVKAF